MRMSASTSHSENAKQKEMIEMNTKTIEAMKKQIKLMDRYVKAHKQHLLDLVDGVPYSDEMGKKVIRGHCENLDFDLRLLTKLGEIIDEIDNSMHTIDDDVSYTVCLNHNLPNPDNPELIVMSGKVLIAALEECDWKETDE